jgi:hypothetical protein
MASFLHEIPNSVLVKTSLGDSILTAPRLAKISAMSNEEEKIIFEEN